MPIIHAHILAGRRPEQKTAFARAVTEAAAAHLNAPPESVRVVIHETPADLWFVAGKPKSDIPSG